MWKSVRLLFARACSKNPKYDEGREDYEIFWRTFRKIQALRHSYNIRCKIFNCIQFFPVPKNYMQFNFKLLYMQIICRPNIEYSWKSWTPGERIARKWKYLIVYLIEQADGASTGCRQGFKNTGELRHFFLGNKVVLLGNLIELFILPILVCHMLHICRYGKLFLPNQINPKPCGYIN